MTRYTVVWHPAARDRLARLWLVSNDRQAVTNAADEIDRELAVDPVKKGSLVRNQLRILCVLPLRVLYRVSEPDRLVTILAVATADRP